jgi:hypothetical protein
MDLSKILGDIRRTFVVRKKVDFDDMNFHFELEPLTAADEAKIMEACKDLEGGNYIMALKRHSLAFAIKKINDFEIGNVDGIDFIDDEGKAKSQSKYLYMLDQINQWPMSLVDRLFEALNSLHEETEDKIQKNSKFEKFIPKQVEERKKSVLKMVEVPPEEAPAETAVDKLNKRVAEEIAAADAQLASQA